MRINDYTIVLLHNRKKLLAYKSFVDCGIGDGSRIICLGDMEHYDEYAEYNLLNLATGKTKKRKGKKRRKGKKKIRRMPVEEEWGGGRGGGGGGEWDGGWGEEQKVHSWQNVLCELHNSTR